MRRTVNCSHRAVGFDNRRIAKGSCGSHSICLVENRSRKARRQSPAWGKMRVRVEMLCGLIPAEEAFSEAVVTMNGDVGAA